MLVSSWPPPLCLPPSNSDPTVPPLPPPAPCRPLRSPARCCLACLPSAANPGLAPAPPARLPGCCRPPCSGTCTRSESSRPPVSSHSPCSLARCSTQMKHRWTEISSHSAGRPLRCDARDQVAERGRLRLHYPCQASTQYPAPRLLVPEGRQPGEAPAPAMRRGPPWGRPWVGVITPLLTPSQHPPSSTSTCIYQHPCQQSLTARRPTPRPPSACSPSPSWQRPAFHHPWPGHYPAPPVRK
jgi:hypothetical protein